MKIRKSTRSFQLFAAVLVLSLASLCSAKAIYVASDGNDAHAGTAPDQPVRTVARSLDLARPGDEVLLKRGGEYDAISLGNVRDLTFRAYGEGAPPLIRGEKAIHGSVKRTITNVTFEDLHLRGNGHGKGVSWLAKTDGLTFRRCRIENYRTNLVIQGADDRPIKNVTLEDCLVLNAHDPVGSGHSHGIFANFVENLVVRRCLFDNNGRRHDNQGTIFNHGLYINVGCGPIVFEDNEINRSYNQFLCSGVMKKGGVHWV